MMMISHHKERGKGNGLECVSKYILTNKCDKNHNLNLWLLQNLMMIYQMRILRLLIPHHHQLDHHYQLNREFAPEEMKDLYHVSEHLHIHLRMLASSHNLLYLLLEFSRPRLWQSRRRWRFSNCGSTKSREQPFKVTTRSRRLTETWSATTERIENCCRKTAK